MPINPIAAFFTWQDARAIARARNARKNRFDIAVLRLLRPTLLLATVSSWVALIWVAEGPSHRFPPGFWLYLIAFSAFLAAAYAWVSAELVFRRYVDEHRE